MEKRSEKIIFAKAYETIEDIKKCGKIINETKSRQYTRISYQVFNENLFNQNCQKLTELGQEYLKVVENKKLPKLFSPPILHKNITSVTTYVNTAYSKKVMTCDEYVDMKVKNIIKEFETRAELRKKLAIEYGIDDDFLVSQDDIEQSIENFKSYFDELQKKYNAKFVIIRLASHDFRGKLRNDENIKRITLKEQGTFFFGKPKFYEQPPKAVRNDLYENKNGVYKVEKELYLSDLEDCSTL